MFFNFQDSDEWQKKFSCAYRSAFDSLHIANGHNQQAIHNYTRSLEQNITTKVDGDYAAEPNMDDSEYIQEASNSWTRIFVSVSNCLMVLNSSINFYIYYGKYRKYLPANRLLCTSVRNRRSTLSTKTTSSTKAGSIELKLKSFDGRRVTGPEMAI